MPMPTCLWRLFPPLLPSHPVILSEVISLIAISTLLILLHSHSRNSKACLWGGSWVLGVVSELLTSAVEYGSWEAYYYLCMEPWLESSTVGLQLPLPPSSSQPSSCPELIWLWPKSDLHSFLELRLWAELSAFSLFCFSSIHFLVWSAGSIQKFASYMSLT